CLSRPRSGMMVVMPALAECEQAYPPDIYAVVWHVIGPVPETADMTNDIEQQRNLQDCQSRQQARQRSLPTETRQDDNPKGQTKRKGQYVRPTPVSALLQKPIHRIDNQILTLLLRIDVRFITRLQKPSHMSVEETISR